MGWILGGVQTTLSAMNENKKEGFIGLILRWSMIEWKQRDWSAVAELTCLADDFFLGVVKWFVGCILLQNR